MATSEAVALAAERFGIDALKPEQGDAFKAFVGVRDVFVCLPTGYGKSLCFAMLPYVTINFVTSVAIFSTISVLDTARMSRYSSLKQRPRGVVVVYGHA